MQKKLLVLGLAALMTAGAANAELKAFKVNGETVSVAEQKAIYDRAVRQGQPASPELERQVKNALIQQTVLLQEAKKAKLESRADVKEAINAAREQVLINALIQDWAKANPVSDKDVKAAYDRQKAAYGDTEYQVRHILVKTEEQAKNLIKRLGNKGANFDKLAQEFSEDTGNKNRGLLGSEAGRSRPDADPHAVRLPRREARRQASGSALPGLRKPGPAAQERAHEPAHAAALPRSCQEGQGRIIRILRTKQGRNSSRGSALFVAVSPA